jgi:hypothetical protein
MALRNGQEQRKKYLTMELPSLSNLIRDLCGVVSEFQSAKIGVITPEGVWDSSATSV